MEISDFVANACGSRAADVQKKGKNQRCLQALPLTARSAPLLCSAYFPKEWLSTTCAVKLASVSLAKNLPFLGKELVQAAFAMSRMAAYGTRMAGPMLEQTDTVFQRAPFEPVGLLASTDSCSICKSS